MLSALFRPRNITKLRIDPPAAQAGRDGLALVLIVRNEARHIGEWARFHALAGVRHVIAYDNGSTDATVAELRGALAEDALTVLPWDQKLRDAGTGREIHNQVLAYAHAARNFGGRFRWMTFLDADEFLIPVQDASLDTGLARLGEVPNVSLPWHMFGRNGHDAAPPGGVLENYLKRNADPMSDAKGLRNFKQVVDPCRLTEIRVHAMQTDGQERTWNDAGRQASFSTRGARAFYSADNLQLNHYYTRSDAELRAKIARGSNQSVKETDHQRRVWRKVENIEASEVEDRTALDFLDRVGKAAPINPPSIAR